VLERSDSDYQDDDVTSMSCAHVTGAVALLRAHFPSDNHDRSSSEILSNTRSVAEPGGQDHHRGRLNLAKALGAAAPTFDGELHRKPRRPGPVPLTVQFTARPGQSGLVELEFWRWIVQRHAKPSHTYNAPGNFTATLTVANSGGQTSSASHTITVTNAPGPTP